MTKVIEHRLETLEVVLAEFIMQTNRSLTRMENDTADFKEEMRQFRDETSLSRREMNIKWGEISNKIGSFAEDIATPTIPRIAREHFGARQIIRHVVRWKQNDPENPGQYFEFDGITETEDTVFFVEAKFTARQDDLRALPNQAVTFRRCFPEYAEKRLIVVFASLFLDQSQINYLTKLGIYALAMGAETMELLNFEEVSKQIRKPY